MNVGGVVEQIVVLCAGPNEYAIPISRVQEIVRVPNIIPLPEAVAAIEGIIDLRGRVLTVVDLSARLHHRSSERSRSARIVVAKPIDARLQPVGLLVNGVTRVLRIAADSVEPANELSGRTSQE